MARDEYVSTEATLAAAEQAATHGRYLEAEAHYRQLLTQTHVVDYEYEEWLRKLAELYQRLGRRREAGVAYLYLHYFDLARDTLPPDARLERARCSTLEKRWLEAAREFLEAGRPVQAAVAYEEAKDHARAREIWAGLVKDARLRQRPYEKALVHFNLGLASQRAAAQSVTPAPGAEAAPDALRHLVESQRLLEQVADDFETRGERERAFDCYQILLKLGKDSGSFENLSEGYLNCIRVLKEDGLKFYVLQYYEDFVKLALERDELHAAATLYREAADYALRTGLPYHRHYLRRSAETWWKAAEKGVATGSPVDLVENAYLASVEASSSIGDFLRVRETYDRLRALPLGDRKQARYAAISAKFAEAPTDVREAPEFPEYLRQPHAYADIWFVDLIEWEMDGDAEQVAAAIVGDLRYPDGFRRRALNVVLAFADARHKNTLGDPATLARVSEALGELQSYAALRPLERLFEHDEPKVRRAAVRALRYLHFKRSFGLIQKALADGDQGVRDAAAEAIRSLHFPHAFHPLARIYREHPEERVKATALESIGKIGSIEAGELLLGVLRHETGALREVARRALATFDNADVIPILRQNAEVESNPEVRKALEELLTRARRR
jgi:hypothetical protein